MPSEGSSPHTRGAPSMAKCPGRTRRIIPAYAGSTRPWSFAGSGCLDHPRIRGEHENLPPSGAPGFGSSPHTRGALYSGTTNGPYHRIIPAYAGSTRENGTRAAHLPDHPRIRGEHDSRFLSLLFCVGSSPHTRGARDDPPQERLGRRIIPAYAGSTTPMTSRCSEKRDHPRIRGEHSRCTTLAVLPSGSSPHTRGAPACGLTRSGRRRIIPAYAGSTSPGVFDPPRGWDHPRIRGEHCRSVR